MEGTFTIRGRQITSNDLPIIFSPLNVKTGKVIGECHRRHRALEFRKFLDRVEMTVSVDLEVHLILDNYRTHKTPAIRRWFARQPRYHLYFTPTAASWINLVEHWFAVLTEKQLRRGVYRSTRGLESAIERFLKFIMSNLNHLCGPGLQVKFY